MDDKEGLRITVSEVELERLRKVARAQGVDLEDWIQEILMRAVRDRDEPS